MSSSKKIDFAAGINQSLQTGDTVTVSHVGIAAGIYQSLQTGDTVSHVGIFDPAL